MSYAIGRPYVDACTRASYRSIKVYGRGNIPEGAPVIIAANHCNTLMDALVILQSFKGPVAFGARADIFRKPFIAKFLNAMNIVPIPRARDGREVLAQSLGVIDVIIESMDHGVPFTIFPEGTHSTTHTLMPLKKGVWRIATRAAETLGKTVYVVPAGLSYSNYYEYKGKVSLVYGEPIPVSADMNPDELLGRLAGDITRLAGYSPSGAVVPAETVNPKPIFRLPRPVKLALAALTSPIALPACTLSAPQGLIASRLCNRLDDKAWSNTMRFASRLLVNPVVVLLECVAAVAFLPLAWGLVLSLLSVYAMSLSYLWHGLLQ